MLYRIRCQVLRLNLEIRLIMAITKRILLVGLMVAAMGALGWSADSTTFTILHTSYDMGYVDPSG